MPYFANKDNIKLFYDVYDENGSADTPTLIMIHGFGSSATFFTEQIKILIKHFRIIVFDAEGHGRSETNPNQKLDYLLITKTVDDLQLLLEELNLVGEFGILGHSMMGGGVALKTALLYPDRVKFLILMNVGTMYIDNVIRNAFWNLLPPMVRMEFNAIFFENLETLLDKTLPYLRHSIERNYNGDYDEDFDKIDGIIEQEIFSMVQEPIDTTGINCPVLIIGGELDNYAPIWMQQDLAQKIEQSEFEIIPMAGHFGPVQQFTQYNEIIENFLKSKGIIL